MVICLLITISTLTCWLVMSHINYRRGQKKLGRKRQLLLDSLNIRRHFIQNMIQEHPHFLEALDESSSETQDLNKLSFAAASLDTSEAIEMENKFAEAVGCLFEKADSVEQISQNVDYVSIREQALRIDDDIVRMLDIFNAAVVELNINLGQLPLNFMARWLKLKKQEPIMIEDALHHKHLQFKAP